MLPWTNARTVAVDANNDVWVGGFASTLSGPLECGATWATRTGLANGVPGRGRLRAWEVREHE